MPEYNNMDGIVDTFESNGVPIDIVRRGNSFFVSWHQGHRTIDYNYGNDIPSRETAADIYLRHHNFEP